MRLLKKELAKRNLHFQQGLPVPTLKVHKHEIFLNTFFAETETIWSQEPVTRDF